tara:strand:- start:3610 stop:4158 length:549 start_codon:yes stop_codon:yes gene_type:complete
MKKILLLMFIIFFSGCNKPKTVLICGDHVCINKAEANQFFEENLTLEVQIVNKKKSKTLDLVQLNLQNKSNNREISIKSKESTSKKIKTLTEREILKIKSDIKRKKDNKKKDQEKQENIPLVKKDNNLDILKKNNNKQKKLIQNDDVIDVCTLLKKCSIDEISNYLIKKGNKKKFPDLTIRQ